MESIGTYKQVYPRSASDARGQKILEVTNYQDADIRSLCCGLTIIAVYFSVQLKSQERRLVKNAEQKTSCAPKITSDLDKDYIVEVEKKGCFKTDVLVNGTYSTTQFLNRQRAFWTK